MMNGLPTVIVEAGVNGERWAPRIVMQCALGPDGRIRAVYLVLATRKLTRVRP